MIAERRKILTMLHEHKITVDESEELLDSLEYTSDAPPEPAIEIITEDVRTQEVINYARRAASGNAPVLIVGEPGTGKELVARMIHQCSPRRENMFLSFGCGLPPEVLLESELFGHVRGAFTGAAQSKAGFIEQVDGGTLFLDEVSSLPMNIQTKLLRFMDTREIQRLGDTKIMRADVRIIAATNRNLQDEAKAGKFSKDLLQRLSVIVPEIPPLREHPRDIPLLVNYFLEKYAQPLNKPIPAVSPEAMDAFMNYSWPGNVRELYNVIQSATTMHTGDTIQLGDLPAMFVKQ